MLYSHGSYSSLRCWCSYSALRYSLAFSTRSGVFFTGKNIWRELCQPVLYFFQMDFMAELQQQALFDVLIFCC